MSTRYLVRAEDGLHVGSERGVGGDRERGAHVDGGLLNGRGAQGRAQEDHAAHMALSSLSVHIV